jgi:hypothetical protein
MWSSLIAVLTTAALLNAPPACHSESALIEADEGSRPFPHWAFPDEILHPPQSGRIQNDNGRTLSQRPLWLAEVSSGDSSATTSPWKRWGVPVAATLVAGGLVYFIFSARGR